MDLIYAGDTEGTLWKFYYDYKDDKWKKLKLFETGGQPITAPPAVAFDFDGNLRIYFGTGAYLEESDKDNDIRNQLQDLTAIVTKDQFDNDLDAAAQTKATDKGWYFQLDIPATYPAKRVLNKALVVSGVVFFTAFVPNQGCLRLRR